MTYPIPKDALDDRLAIVGTAGSGKTYLALGAVEHLLHRKARVIFIDPLGVAWGLRLCADGETPSPFQPVIFGGAHGDLPINEHAGALIGQAIATSPESCIIDLSQLGTKSAERRFMLALLTALYRDTNKEPVHLIIDEADMFAPQRLMDKEGDAAKLLGMMETIVRRGRVKGFVPWLLTQRPAVLSKDVLSQADGLVALKLTAKQDRDAIGGWIEGQADTAEGKAILASLPSKQRGEGVLWMPGRGILEHVAFPGKATFDSSRTPKRGERVQAATLNPIDLGALKSKLAAVEDEVKANDPRALRAEIARLKSVAAKATTLSVPSNEAAKINEAAIECARSEGYARGFRTGFENAKHKTLSALFGATGTLRAAAENLESDMHAAARTVVPAQSGALPSRTSETPSKASEFRNPAAQQKHIPQKTNSNGSLPPGERAVLIAAAQFNGVDRDQLSVLTGYKRSSRDAYIQRLREKGYVEVSGQTIAITDAGNGALPPDYEPLPTGRAIQNYWLERLPEGERRILSELISAFPNYMPRSDLDDATGYKRSSRDAYLQRMKARRLVEMAGATVRASQELF
jgi:uncharacterized protein